MGRMFIFNHVALTTCSRCATVLLGLHQAAKAYIPRFITHLLRYSVLHFFLDFVKRNNCKLNRSDCK